MPERRFLSILFALILLLLVCTEQKQEQPNVNLNVIYQAQDTLALREAIISDHQQVRRLIDKQLAKLINARSDADSSRIDSLTEKLSWLCNTYQNTTHCTDKTNRLRLYLQLSSDEAIKKKQLDSVLLTVNSLYKKTPDSVLARQRIIYLDKLRQLFRDYRNLDDEYQAASVAFYIGRVFFDAGQADSCLYYLDQCRTICQRIGHPDVLGDCELWLANVYNLYYADYLKAQEAILQVERLFKKTGKDEYLAYAQIQRLHILRNLYQTDRVIDGLHASLNEFSSQENKQVHAYCQYFLGEAFYDQGFLDSAAYYAKQSYSARNLLAKNNTGLLSDIGYSKSLLGLVAQARSDTTEAEQQYTAADRLFRQASDTNGICMNFLRQSLLLIGKGEFEKAGRQYWFVLNHSGQFEDSILALYGLAVVDYFRGDIRSAIPRLRNCIAKLETTRHKLPIPEMKTGMLSDKSGFFNLLTCIYFESSLRSHDKVWLDSAFNILERSKSQVLIDNLRTESSSTPKSDEAEIIERISHIDQILLTTNEDSSSLLAQRRLLEDSLDAVRIVQASKENILPFMGNNISQLKDVKYKLIKPGVVVLEYLLSGFGSYLLALSTDTIIVIPLDVDRSHLEKQIRKYVNAISHYPTVGDTAQTWRQTGEELCSALLPVEKLNLKQYKQLIIIPSGMLHYLPFSALIDSDGSFLIEKFDISYDPSLTTLAFLKSRKDSLRGDNGKEVIAFGSPVFTDTNIDPLPFSRNEVDAIVDIFGAELVHTFLNADATVNNLENYNYDNAKYLHLATHGYSDNYRPNRSALLFSQNSRNNQSFLLSASRISSLTIGVDLVFLSSCQSGTGILYPGEGVLSLAQPFLVAGAGSVIVTYWNVDDRCSVNFVRRFYTAIKKGHTKVYSLAQAQRELITSRYKHPYYWAAYVLTGMPE